jgi:hypothetical protein
MNASVSVLAALALVVLAGIVGTMDYEDQLMEVRAYCAQVTLYHASAGLHGWPDYRQLYSTVCAKYADDPELFSKG